MNTRLPSAFLAFATALALPALSRAVDLSPEILADEFVDASPALSPAPIPNESGVILRDGKAYILQRLQSDLTLPNGSIVDPNGRVTGLDGASRMMQTGQVLSLDGQLQQRPAGSDQPFSTPSLIPGSTGSTSTQDFFAPASGTFPGRSDATPSSPPVNDQPDTGDFSD